jgi:hypothetical protein
MCDILLGYGYVSGAAPSSQAKVDVSARIDVDVIFCNPDLLWKNEFEVPRLGQGGFQVAWRAVWDVGPQFSACEMIDNTSNRHFVFIEDIFACYNSGNQRRRRISLQQTY